MAQKYAEDFENAEADAQALVELSAPPRQFSRVKRTEYKITDEDMDEDYYGPQWISKPILEEDSVLSTPHALSRRDYVAKIDDARRLDDIETDYILSPAYTRELTDLVDVLYGRDEYDAQSRIEWFNEGVEEPHLKVELMEGRSSSRAWMVKIPHQNPYRGRPKNFQHPVQEEEVDGRLPYICEQRGCAPGCPKAVTRVDCDRIAKLFKEFGDARKDPPPPKSPFGDEFEEDPGVGGSKQTLSGSASTVESSADNLPNSSQVCQTEQESVPPAGSPPRMLSIREKRPPTPPWPRRSSYIVDATDIMARPSENIGRPPSPPPLRPLTRVVSSTKPVEKSSHSTTKSPPTLLSQRRDDKADSSRTADTPLNATNKSRPPPLPPRPKYISDATKPAVNKPKPPPVPPKKKHITTTTKPADEPESSIDKPKPPVPRRSSTQVAVIRSPAKEPPSRINKPKPPPIPPRRRPVAIPNSPPEHIGNVSPQTYPPVSHQDRPLGRERLAGKFGDTSPGEAKEEREEKEDIESKD